MSELRGESGVGAGQSLRPFWRGVEPRNGGGTAKRKRAKSLDGRCGGSGRGICTAVRIVQQSAQVRQRRIGLPSLRPDFQKDFRRGSLVLHGNAVRINGLQVVGRIFDGLRFRESFARLADLRIPRVE